MKWFVFMFAAIAATLMVTPEANRSGNWCLYYGSDNRHADAKDRSCQHVGNREW